jgi:methyl-accepting chemotaxis protein
LARIGTRLGVAFGLMGVLMLGLGAFSAARLQSVSREFVDVLDTRLPRLELTQSVLDDLNGLNIAARDAIGASAEEMMPLIARIDKGREQVGSKAQQLQDAFKDDGELGAKTAEAFAGHGSGVLVSLVKFTRALRAQNAEAATRTLRESIQPRLNGMMTAVESYRGGQLAALQEGKANGDRSTRSALVAIAALVGVSLVVAGVASLLIARSITRPLSEAVDAGQAIADGDLRVRPVSGVRHEAGMVMTALRGISERIGEVVRSIRGAAARIDVSARDIVAGSLRLSSSSADLSVRLQGSVSATGEIRAMVESSAAGARQVDARAREQGRGFAVVVAEVRSLATRTTGSSAEIRKLIDSSVAQVNSNVDRIEQVGTKMNSILGDVDDVSASVAGISAALVQQLERIGEADANMAALERSNTETGSMIGELEQMSRVLDQAAHELSEQVSVFQVQERASV